MTKLLIGGMGRSGKDTACEILEEQFGMTFTSSSWAAAEIFIFEQLRLHHNYKTVQECFDDRHSGDNRMLWYDMITEYNTDDKARLAKDILKKSDIYCGLRSKEELDECKRQGVFDLTIWIEATDRIGITESSGSITVTKDDFDIIIENNTSLTDFEQKIIRLGKALVGDF